MRVTTISSVVTLFTVAASCAWATIMLVGMLLGAILVHLVVILMCSG
jgi:hypothetical protein